jgi:amidase
VDQPNLAFHDGLKDKLVLFVVGASVPTTSYKSNRLPNNKDPFCRLDATAQAELVRSRAVHPIELIDAAIARIEALNGSVNAVISRNFERARAQAKGPLPNGPFKGVPHLLKDLSAVRGMPLTYGSRLFKQNRPLLNEAITRRVIQGGFITLGKTNTCEFGLLPSTEPLLHGATRNPWNLGHSPGGSSGGAAAVVASGMVPIAQASDGGGSIRIPASCCGLFGLKPSRGRTVPLMRKIPGDFAVNLCLSRSVRDTARFLDLIERKDRLASFPRLGYVAGPSKRRLRIAFCSRDILGREPEAELKSAIDQVVQLCADLGHTVEEANLRVDGERAIQCFIACWAAGPASLVKYFWAIRLRAMFFRPMADALEPWTLGLAEWFRAEEAKRPGVLPRALKTVQELTAQVDAFFSGYDVYLTPVVRRLPPKIGEFAPTVPFENLLANCIDYIAYTPLYNATGIPAMSVPLSMSKDGLPIGSQFAARAGDERTLLELAYELEQVRPWAQRWPQIALPTLPDKAPTT